MLEISLITTRLLINTVKNNDYTDILLFYQDEPHYFFATGEKDINDINSLHNKIMSKTVDNYFFCSVRLITSSKIIGCISGFIDIDKSLLWIYMLIVDVNYQQIGYGTEIFRSVLKCLSEKFLINAVLIGVANDNVNGQNFWQKQGFSLFKHQNTSKSHKIYIFHVNA